MNPYLETLKDELREELGEDICQADWDEFYDGLEVVDAMSGTISTLFKVYSGEDVDCDKINEGAEECTKWAKGTRADLPSIVKYAYAAIEENLK